LAGCQPIPAGLATTHWGAGANGRSLARIAESLIALRKRRGLNQTQLAELTGTKQPAIARVEQADYQNWNIKTLRTIAEALDARVRVLIEASEDILSEYDQDADVNVEGAINTQIMQSDALVDLSTVISENNNSLGAIQSANFAMVYDQGTIGRLSFPANFTWAAPHPWMTATNPTTPFWADHEKIKLRQLVLQQQETIAKKNAEIAALNNQFLPSTSSETAEALSFPFRQRGSTPAGWISAQ
jgi:transcriptional regulator with XRE-family HTH domain